MKKPITFLLFMLLTLSCGGGDDAPIVEDPNPEPVGVDDDNPTDGQDNDISMVSLNLAGVSDLKFNDLSVVSASGSTEFITNNELPDIGDYENPDLPILFMNDSNVLMGYFPETLEGEEIKIEDVVYFFFKTFPSLAVRRLDDATLNNLLVKAPKYETMVGLVKDALNQNVSVIDNPQFDSLVREIVAEYDESSNKSAKENIEEFRFDYDRSGKITIPEKSPLYSSLGVQINLLGLAEPVYGPALLKKKNLPVSPSSAFSWLLDTYVFKPEPISEEFLMVEDGIYEVVFSNGWNSSYPNFDDTIKNQNYKYFAITALGYAVPFGLEKLLSKKQCKDETEKLIASTVQIARDLVEEKTVLSTSQLISLITNLGKDVGNASVCYFAGESDLFFSKFVTSIIYFAAKRLQVAEDISEMVFLVRDFYGSDILGRETRYFDNGYSFGELNMEVNSPLSFTLEPETQFDFLSRIDEVEISYDVSRNLLRSWFTKNTDLTGAQGIGFNTEISPPNSASFNNTGISSTDVDGIFRSSFISGNENGKITIEPNFNTKDISATQINLQILTEEEELEQMNTDIMEKYRWDFEYSENCTFSHTSSSHEGVLTSETSCPKLNKGYFNGTTFNNTTEPQDGETYELSFSGNNVNFSYVRVEKTNTQETNLTSNYSYQYDQSNNVFIGNYNRTYYSTNPISGSWLRYVWSGTSILRSSPKN